jgi:hypothetical protein
VQTLQQITQEIIAQVEGGVFTDETKFQEPYIDSLVHQARADLFRQNPEDIISNFWIQSYYPTYSQYINDNGDCYVAWVVDATPLLGNDGTDMTTYFGPANGKIGYNRIGLYGSEAVDFAHPLTNPNKKGLPSYKWGYVEAFGKMGIKCYGNIDIQSPRVDFVHFDPTQNPNYRRSTDLYPISGELLAPLKLGALNKLMAQQAQVPSDSLANSEDLTNQQQVRIK